jgi:hypothetical protein
VDEIDARQIAMERERVERALVALVSVADCAQTVVMEWIRDTWPVCPFHEVGLHAGVEKDQAIWECKADGGHVVAPVGRLSSRS